MRDIETIDEVFEDGELMEPETRSGDVFDEADGNQTPHSRMSDVSSMSEIYEDEADYDTDLEMDEESTLIRSLITLLPLGRCFLFTIMTLLVVYHHDVASFLPS